MSLSIIKIALRYEHDIVLARQRARTIAGLLGFDVNEQTRISTAVSEIARNAFQYAGGGEVEFLVEGTAPPQVLVSRICDRGPGIADVAAVLEGRYRSPTGMGLGLLGAKRLMDYFHLESTRGKGTTAVLGKTIPRGGPTVVPATLAQIAEALLMQSPQNPFEEVQRQNQELLRTMNELKQRQEDLEALNRELEDTNRGMVALYAELDEKASHLNRANDLKARFLSNMSHEFRTPLNSVLSLSRLLLDRVDGELTPEQEKQTRFIRKAAEDLSGLVNDLLDLAKIEAGKTTVHSVPCDVANLFSALRGMLKPMLVNPAVELIVEEPVGVPTLRTDEGKISQILRNLVSNAIKFTERGEIRVTARLAEDGARVAFTVADTGIGVAPEHLEHIFEEYAQVDSTLQQKVKGTGLGLPLSRKLANLLGGTLTVASAPAQGSVFTALLPITYEEPEEGGKPPSPLDPTRRQVLVVEDDPATLLLYEKFFKGTGFQLRRARNLREARQELTAEKPTAIVLDILLGGEDGWEFLVELKAGAATRDIPVFVASVLAQADKGFSLGADDFITKPVERTWLLNKLGETAARGPLQKVLVIDDEEVARYLLKGLLADSKYTVLEAAGGVEGLRVAETEKPQLIFLDLLMPEMDGFETLSRLQASPATRDIPVVIITSKLLDEEERKLLNQKTLAVLSKESTSQEAAVAKIRDAVARIGIRG